MNLKPGLSHVETADQVWKIQSLYMGGVSLGGYTLGIGVEAKEYEPVIVRNSLNVKFVVTMHV